MNAKRVISRLKSLGTEQTRKTYVRHGVEDAFGVLYSDFYKLAKQAAVAKKKAARARAVVLQAICSPKPMSLLMAAPADRVRAP